MWNLSELNELARRENVNKLYLLNLSRMNDELIQMLKCIRESIKNVGKTNIFIDDRILKSEYSVSTSKLQNIKAALVNKNLFGDMKIPVNKKDMELFTYLFAVDFAKEIGTANKVLLGSTYPLVVNDGEFNIGFKSKNAALVRSIYGNLIESK